MSLACLLGRQSLEPNESEPLTSRLKLDYSYEITTNEESALAVSDQTRSFAYCDRRIEGSKKGFPS